MTDLEGYGLADPDEEDDFGGSGQADAASSPEASPRLRSAGGRSVQCLDCLTTWPNRLALTRHKQHCGREAANTAAGDGSGHVCGFCSSVWPDQRSLKQHLCNCRLRLQEEATQKLLSGESTQVQCGVCYKYFYSRQMYQLHCKMSHGQTTEDCAEGDAANKGEAENDASGDEKEAAGENEAETPDGGEDRVSTRSTKMALRRRSTRSKSPADVAGSSSRRRKSVEPRRASPDAAADESAAEEAKRTRSGRRAAKRTAPETPPKLTATPDASPSRKQPAAKKAKTSKAGGTSDSDSTDGATGSGSVSEAFASARSLSSRRNANSQKQCMDCHEMLPNALALAQHKRRGCMEGGESPTAGSPKNTQNSVAIKPDPDSSDLVSKPLASSTTSATTNASTSLVTCLDCGDKCADFSRLREHKKWACPKTHGDMSRTALLARPIRCLNCHDASFHSYLDLHKHQVNECPMTKVQSGPFECDHCTEQFDTVLKYSHHLATCPIRQLLTAAEAPLLHPLDEIPGEDEDETGLGDLASSYSLAQNLGMDLGSFKQEVLDEPGDDDVMGDVGKEALGLENDLAEDAKETGAKPLTGSNAGKRKKKGKPTPFFEEKFDVVMKEEPIDLEDERYGEASPLAEEPDAQCTLCGEEFVTAALCEQHVLMCPLNNTMATGDMMPGNSDEDEAGSERLYGDLDQTGNGSRKSRRSMGKKRKSQGQGGEVNKDDVDVEMDQDEAEDKWVEVERRKRKRQPTKNGTDEDRDVSSVKESLDTSLLKVKMKFKEGNKKMKKDPNKTQSETKDTESKASEKGSAKGKAVSLLDKDKLERLKLKVTCLDCGFGAANRAELDLHKRTCTAVGSTRVFACLICSSAFYTRDELNYHKRAKHGGRESLQVACEHEYCFVCSKCGQRFPMKSDCQLHFIEKHQDSLTTHNLAFCTEQCKRCGMLVKCKHTIVYLCRVCRKKFSTLVGCKVHFYEAHPIELGKQKLPVFTCIEKCLLCNLEISVDSPDQSKEDAKKTMTSLKSRSSTVTSQPEASDDDAPTKTPCENCMTSFDNVDAFLEHLPCSRVLGEESPEKSRTDKTKTAKSKSKGAADQSALSGAGECFQCGICQDTFTSKRALLSHKPCFGLQSEDGKYMCLACQVLFASEADFQAHKRSAHGQQGAPMTCWECGESFRVYVDLSQHRLKVHGSGRKQVIPRAQLKEDNISVVLVDGERNVVERVTRDNLREVLQHNIRVPGSFTPFVARATGSASGKSGASQKRVVSKPVTSSKQEKNAASPKPADVSKTPTKQPGVSLLIKSEAVSPTAGSDVTKSNVTSQKDDEELKCDKCSATFGSQSEHAIHMSVAHGKAGANKGRAAEQGAEREAEGKKVTSTPKGAKEKKTVVPVSLAVTVNATSTVAPSSLPAGTTFLIPASGAGLAAAGTSLLPVKAQPAAPGAGGSPAAAGGTPAAGARGSAAGSSVRTVSVTLPAGGTEQRGKQVAIPVVLPKGVRLATSQGITLVPAVSTTSSASTKPSTSSARSIVTLGPAPRPVTSVSAVSTVPIPPIAAIAAPAPARTAAAPPRVTTTTTAAAPPRTATAPPPLSAAPRTPVAAALPVSTALLTLPPSMISSPASTGAPRLAVRTSLLQAPALPGSPVLAPGIPRLRPAVGAAPRPGFRAPAVTALPVPSPVVLNQGPDGKLVIQTPGISDYKVSMVAAPDGSFQLKFDKPGEDGAASAASKSGGKKAETAQKQPDKSAQQKAGVSKQQRAAPQKTAVKSPQQQYKAIAAATKITPAVVAKQLASQATTTLQQPIMIMQQAKMGAATTATTVSKQRPVLPKLSVPAGQQSLLKPLQICLQQPSPLPGKPHSLLLPKLPQQQQPPPQTEAQPLKIGSVGQLIRLPDGKQIFCPDNSVNGANSESEAKSPLVVSQTPASVSSSRKSAPRRKARSHEDVTSSEPQPILIEPQEEVDDPDEDLVYTFRCSGCGVVFPSAAEWQVHAELCRNWSRGLHPIIETHQEGEMELLSAEAEATSVAETSEDEDEIPSFLLDNIKSEPLEDITP